MQQQQLLSDIATAVEAFGACRGMALNQLSTLGPIGCGKLEPTQPAAFVKVLKPLLLKVRPLATQSVQRGWVAAAAADCDCAESGGPASAGR